MPVNFKQRWGSIVNLVRTDKPSQTLYYPIYMARRVVLVMVALFMTNKIHNVIQLQITMYVNMMCIMYQIGQKPLTGKLINVLDIFN